MWKKVCSNKQHLVLRCTSHLFYGCFNRGNVILLVIGVLEGAMKVVVVEVLTLWAFLGLGRRSVAGPSQAYSQN